MPPIFILVCLEFISAASLAKRKSTFTHAKKDKFDVCYGCLSNVYFSVICKNVITLHQQRHCANYMYMAMNCFIFTIMLKILCACHKVLMRLPVRTDWYHK